MDIALGGAMAKDLVPEGSGVVYHIIAKRVVCVWVY
jgi:hypothetical protein